MTRRNTYLVELAPRFSATFEVDGVATDPSTTTFRTKSPDGTVTSYVEGTDVELVRDSAGVFHLDLLLGAAGWWTVRWEGTGTAQGADEYQVRVEPSAFT